MAGFFKKNNNAQPISERALLSSKVASTRVNLLLVVIFSLVNIALLLTNSNYYFLFSAFIPYVLVFEGMFFTGKFPAEYYAEYDYVEFDPPSFLWTLVAVAAVLVLFYLVCWFFSKKRPVGWFVIALVFFSIDTVAMFLLQENIAESLIDVVFHFWVIYSLITGIRSHLKLKKLPPEEAIVPDPAEAVEVSSTEAEN